MARAVSREMIDFKLKINSIYYSLPVDLRPLKTTEFEDEKLS
jgi:hypothetical protein